MVFTSIKIKDWLWVFYPILTAVFIIISLNFLMGSGPESIMSVISKQDENNQEEIAVEQLKAKLEILQGVNREINRLKSLLAAMPPAKRIWFLVEAVDYSASNAGIVIDQFGGTVGDIKEASDSATMSAQITDTDPAKLMSLKIDYKQTAFGDLYNAIKQMENYLPFVKVAKVSYDPGKVSVTVEGGWGQFLKPLKDASTPLPVYENTVSKALNDIREMQDLTAEEN
jgi:hypothetical protein